MEIVMTNERKWLLNINNSVILMTNVNNDINV